MVSAAGATLEPGPQPADQVERTGFHVRLANFDGPFDLLLQLIGAHRMDVTEVALSQVTAEFLAFLSAEGDDSDLGVTTEFLVVAATLLDLKAARLLPQADLDDSAEASAVEGKDLLFARLLAYRAYQQVAELFTELEAAAPRRYPRAVTLEDRYLGLLPEVRIGLSPEALAVLAGDLFVPKPPPQVSLEHIHISTISVAEHTAIVRTLLTRAGEASFEELVVGCTATMEVVARFLALLHLYRESAVTFTQPVPLERLTVRWVGVESAGPDVEVPDVDVEEYQ